MKLPLLPVLSKRVSSGFSTDQSSITLWKRVKQSFYLSIHTLARAHKASLEAFPYRIELY
jgi:hypothetical protein